VLTFVLSVATAAGQTTADGTIAEIHVQGNRLLSDAEVVALAAIAVGDPFRPETLEDVRARLVASGAFEDVDVRKRFASISDTTRVAVVILIDAHPVGVAVPDAVGAVPRVVGRPGPDNLMLLPRLGAEDGYGLTYGVELAFVEPVGERSRLAVPLTWGGTRRAGAVFSQEFAGGPVSRVEVGAALERRRHPSLGIGDSRRRTWAVAERHVGAVTVEGSAEYARVRFGAIDEPMATVGAAAAFDTRVDPTLPRDAVYVRAGVSRVWFPGPAGRLHRVGVDLRGYVGLLGQSILVARATRLSANGPQPAYLQPLVGGWSTLRGFEAWAFRGDQATSGSLELRLPLSKVLSAVRTGVSLFVDAGAAAPHGRPVRRQRFHVGSGVGLWFAAPGLQLGVSVAHGRGAGTRVNFGGRFGL